MAKAPVLMREKVNRDVLVEYSVKAGIFKNPAEAKDVSVDDLCDKYIACVKKHVKKDELADCDNCQGTSSHKVDRCPFCGVGDPDPQKEGTDNMKKSDKGKKDKGSKGEEKAEKGKKADAALAKVEKETKAVALPEGVTVEALDAKVAEVTTLKGDASASMWRLGKAIGDLYDGQFWKARTTEDGTPKYKHWNAFCQEELGMTPTNAYSLMDVAKAFSEDQVRAFGTTKLGIILKAPEEAQPKLLEVAGQTGKRGLQKKVDEENKKKGKKGKRETGRKKTPEGVPGAKGLKSKKPEHETITIATLLGNKSVPLYKNPGKGKEPTERAKKVADAPVGWVDLENGVRLFIGVTEDSGGSLVAKLSFKRIEE